MYDPSGDQDGFIETPSSVSCVMPVPSAFMRNKFGMERTPCATWRVNTMRSPSGDQANEVIWPPLEAERPPSAVAPVPYAFLTISCMTASASEPSTHFVCTKPILVPSGDQASSDRLIGCGRPLS